MSRPAITLLTVLICKDSYFYPKNCNGCIGFAAGLPIRDQGFVVRHPGEGEGRLSTKNVLTARRMLDQPTIVAANSATGFDIPNHRRRTRARILSAFFVLRTLWSGTLGLFGGPLPTGRYVNPTCPATRRLTSAVVGEILTVGADQMARQTHDRAISIKNDPHLGWLESWRASIRAFYDVDDEPETEAALLVESDKFAKLIATTAPTTIAGARAQLRLLFESSCELESCGTPFEKQLLASGLTFLEGCSS